MRIYSYVAVNINGRIHCGYYKNFKEITVFSVFWVALA